MTSVIVLRYFFFRASNAPTSQLAKEFALGSLDFSFKILRGIPFKDFLANESSPKMFLTKRMLERVAVINFLVKVSDSSSVLNLAGKSCFQPVRRS